MTDTATTASSCQDPIPGIIPFATLTLVGGAPGSGKTTLLAEWCQRWRDGRTICQRPTNPPTALHYLVLDRPWQTGYAPIFEKIGFADIPHSSLVDDQTIGIERLGERGAAELFGDYLKVIDPPVGAHLFVEPLSPFFILGKPNDQRDVARTMVWLNRVCKNCQINITATVHFGKQKGDVHERYVRPQDRIAGSTSFAGFSFTQIYVMEPEPPDRNFHTVGWVPRFSYPEEFEFKRSEQGLFVPVTYEEQLTPRAERVYAYIPMDYSPITLAEIVSASGMPERTVRRALQDLVKYNRVERVGRGYLTAYRRLRPQ